MQKKTRALSGASQDAYFRRVFKAYPNLSVDERERLVQRLRQEIAQLRLRRSARSEAETPSPEAPTVRAPATPAGARVAAVPAASISANISTPFDPFSPNVIVVVRTAGRDAALAALTAIDCPDNLRLLAREQRLAVAGDPTSATDLRAAIVAAAERRIANRMAAAS
ncbi:MAG TPA: hypothetical protein VFR73_03535 [Hyphomicrobiaceae bacterium]|nr:hypothetical protein [Hyphomicrobiaceae bacterium]